MAVRGRRSAASLPRQGAGICNRRAKNNGGFEPSENDRLSGAHHRFVVGMARCAVRASGWRVEWPFADAAARLPYQDKERGFAIVEPRITGVLNRRKMIASQGPKTERSSGRQTASTAHRDGG